MTKKHFMPKEVLFSVTSECSLKCAHCGIKQVKGALGLKKAVKFLKRCAKYGIKRAGFTGGEPLLKSALLCGIVSEAVRTKVSFDRIMTNGVPFRSEVKTAAALTDLYSAGYDGDICMSVDAFHRQDLKQIASFILMAAQIWRRPDIVSIASVGGAMDNKTLDKLSKLSRLLDAKLVRLAHGNMAIKSARLFIKIIRIDLSPVGKAARLKKPWGNRWFKDDLCEGPGNVLFVLPDGTVKPCCGYANESDLLSIGSIKADTPKKMIEDANKDFFISTVFSKGLHPIRKSLEKAGIKFPGKTLNHCFFCHYLINNVPRRKLTKCLEALR